MVHLRRFVGVSIEWIYLTYFGLDATACVDVIPIHFNIDSNFPTAGIMPREAC